jgi:hypothetical protein
MKYGVSMSRRTTRSTINHRLILAVMAVAIGACSEQNATSPDIDLDVRGARSSTSNASTSVWLDDATGVLGTGDGLGTRYQNGVCGVGSTLYLSGSNDNIMSTNSSTASDKKCTKLVGGSASSVPRKLRIHWPDGTVENLPGGVNVLQLGTAVTGDYRQVGIHFSGSAKCGERLQFSATDESERLAVTKDGDNAWTISGTDRTARCVVNQVTVGTVTGVNISFRVTAP